MVKQVLQDKLVLRVIQASKAKQVLLAPLVLMAKQALLAPQA
jgi:hypothetical protein